MNLVQEIETQDAPSRARQLVSSEDILVSTVRPNLNGIAIVPDELDGATASTGYCVLRCNERLDPLYLYYWVQTPDFVSDMVRKATGANYPAVTDRVVKTSTIPLPPLETQKHIARVLEQADQLRKQAQQMESELNLLAQSLFLEMFGDPVNNEKAWPQFTLAQLTIKIGSGATPTGGKEAYKDIGTSLIRSLNVHDGEFLYKNLARLDDQQSNALSNVVVEQQDVLLNITGASVCRCCVVPRDALPARVNQHVAILRPDNVKLTTAYLQALIVSPSFKVSLLQLAGAAGATREALTKGALEALQIPAPPLEKQIEYGRATNSISMQIDVIKRKQAQLNSLFESLMQRAFNGELTAPERKAA